MKKKRKKYYTKQTEQKANETWEWQKTLEGQKKRREMRNNRKKSEREGRRGRERESGR